VRPTRVWGARRAAAVLTRCHAAEGLAVRRQAAAGRPDCDVAPHRERTHSSAFTVDHPRAPGRNIDTLAPSRRAPRRSPDPSPKKRRRHRGRLFMLDQAVPLFIRHNPTLVGMRVHPRPATVPRICARVCDGSARQCDDFPQRLAAVGASTARQHADELHDCVADSFSIVARPSLKAHEAQNSGAGSYPRCRRAPALPDTM